MCPVPAVSWSQAGEGLEDLEVRPREKAHFTGTAPSSITLTEDKLKQWMQNIVSYDSIQLRRGTVKVLVGRNGGEGHFTAVHGRAGMDGWKDVVHLVGSFVLWPRGMSLVPKFFKLLMVVSGGHFLLVGLSHGWSNINSSLASHKMDLSLEDQSLANLAALALTRLPELEFGRAGAQGYL
ncbi:unnamed protein product [Fusarium graminearum]|uniref:Chromosome 1, complete genome n=1 Tax=Gibberella zeae (strain ATCC MYA-4620 / CBS 123657 / FGSC 9075 / NRRL 31084 / PH-1) TaxID=229533 RepID=A0A098D3F4_GIBZE|nr:unnamed protein product [Fusarium graminearum]CZS75760.1 unnamed protein product [Fusarium graminearum]